MNFSKIVVQILEYMDEIIFIIIIFHCYIIFIIIKLMTEHVKIMLKQKMMMKKKKKMLKKLMIKMISRSIFECIQEFAQQSLLWIVFKRKIRDYFFIRKLLRARKVHLFAESKLKSENVFSMNLMHFVLK